MRIKSYIAAIIFFLIFLWCIRVIFLPASFKDKFVYIYIDKGKTKFQIANLLADKKVIKSRLFFILFSYSKNLKYGEYKLNTNNNIFQIINLLQRGGTLHHTIVIPEGFTSCQIADELQERNIVKRDDFLFYVNNPELLNLNHSIFSDIKSLEGFLFPDTYFFQRGIKTSDILKKMLNRFLDVLPDDFYKRAKELNLTPYEIIIFASLVEKEAKVEYERSIIASIFLNRYKKNIPLQSCASVQYALGRKKYKKLYFKDLKINSPYNTYLYSGLPPTPISNPGLASIKAILYPKKTEYLYFVSKGDGTHIFSKTFKEHVSIKNKIKKMK